MKTAQLSLLFLFNYIIIITKKNDLSKYVPFMRIKA